jgi:hypothetical protein
MSKSQRSTLLPLSDDSASHAMQRETVNTVQKIKRKYKRQQRGVPPDGVLHIKISTMKVKENGARKTLKRLEGITENIGTL